MGTALKKALALSQQMLAAAQAGDWELLCRLEIDEKHLLTNLEATSETKDMAKLIQATHVKILDLAVPARDDMKELLDTFSKHSGTPKTE